MSNAAELDWGAFFQLHRPLALRVAGRWATQGESAEDLVHEAARAMLARARSGELALDSELHARNYFLRAIHNVAASRARTRARATPEDVVESELPGPGPGPVEELLDAEATLEGERNRRELQRAIAALGTRDRQLLQWRYGEGLTFREIAARTGKAISTLQARVESALKRIRHDLGKDGPHA